MAKMLVSDKISKIAYEMLAEETPLNAKDLLLLGKKGPVLLRKLRSKKKKDLNKLDAEDVRLLLAYVVYLRQNLTTEPTDLPNFEDAAKILHEEILDDAKRSKVQEELIKQLSKAGLNLE